MEQDPVQPRVGRVPSVGARLCLLIGVLLVIAAAYFLLLPLRVTAGNGTAWECGTALSAPTDDFSTGLCGRINATYAARSIALLAAAVVTAIGGFLVFGSEQRTRTPEVRVASDPGESVR